MEKFTQIEIMNGKCLILYFQLRFIGIQVIILKYIYSCIMNKMVISEELLRKKGIMNWNFYIHIPLDSNFKVGRNFYISIWNYSLFLKVEISANRYGV